MGQGINNKNINKDEKTNIQFFNEVRVIETNSREKRYNPGREYKREVEQKKWGGGEQQSWIHANIPRWMFVVFEYYFCFLQAVNQSLNKWVHCTALGLLLLFAFSPFLFFSCRFRLVWFIAVDWKHGGIQQEQEQQHQQHQRQEQQEQKHTLNNKRRRRPIEFYSANQRCWYWALPGLLSEA